MAITLRFGAPVWGAALFLVLLALLVGVVWLLVTGTHNTAFTVRGQTDVLTVQPGCGQSVTWDLPPGQLRSLDPAASAAAGSADQPVSLVIREGAQALLEIRDGHELRVLVTPMEGTPRCGSAAGPTTSQASEAASSPLPFSVLVLSDTAPSGAAGTAREISADGDPRTSTAGYAYRSSQAPLRRFDLRLAGRVLLGSPVVDGGGWTGSQRGMLRAATIEGRIRQWPGDQQAVLLRDEVDTGSMVDTHACLGRGGDSAAIAACEAIDRHPAVGFATLAKRDDVPVLEVVVHRQADSIGVLPYAGDQRRARVSTWTRLIHMPLAQQTVALLVLLTTLLGHYAALRPLLTCLLPRRWRIGLSEAAGAARPAADPPPKPASPPPDGGSP